MNVPRIRITLRVLMALVAVAAIWCFIVAEGVAYRWRHPGSAWSDR